MIDTKQRNATAAGRIRKLRENRGASISFALLLFLVCAVIGSIVLVAGTAAAGRMSGLADADQRYFSVTSAARLLREKLDNRVITLELSRSWEETTVTVIEEDADGNETIPSPPPSPTPPSDDAKTYPATAPQWDVGGALTEVTAGKGLLEDATLKYVFGSVPSTSSSTLWNGLFPTATSTVSNSYSLSNSASSDNKIKADALKVEVTVEQENNKTVTVTVKNAVSDGEPYYAVKMTFSPVYEMNDATQRVPTDHSYTSSTDADRRVITHTVTDKDTVTETRRITVQWTLTSTEEGSGI